MYYLIDGYNLLYSLQESRDRLVKWFQKEFAQLDQSGMIVFDGAHRRDEESGRAYGNPLEVSFAPKGQTADAYILEQVQLLKNVTVVTNDGGLKRQARAFGAKTMTNEAFLEWLAKKRKKKVKKVEVRESPREMERLLKAFEERLKHNLEGGE